MRPGFLVALAFGLFLVWPTAGLAGGNNLSWDACGSDGTLLRLFACDRNIGVDVIVGSTRLAQDLPTVIGLTAEVDFVSTAATWPDWWRVFVPGSCRRTSISASFTDPAFGGGACADPWSGVATGAVMSYTLEAFPYGLARLQLSSGVAPENALSFASGDHVFDFALRIDHQRTVGTDACFGCQSPVCILLRRVTFHQPVGVGDYISGGPDERDEVFWQSSSLPNGCFVPTQNRTWGAIKGMYR